ncbi:phosphatase PAP2 family protein [Magnetospirillum fulvum]|uniref:Membrane-associated enzyme, PAP2 (Acid phosphatase) superfamily n=1 Tax=Magnetospirillum fulvum TaxID=1082 RepID=A0A1H6IMP5_MAGFU|nr:phosphatase PAP2 family protein [Magnetospirillum fulvum]SEH49287.1 Membrane-associated enzyme, PAP2 (acid phosphatase) superfamily [Magnetospirillum fulvum]
MRDRFGLGLRLAAWGVPLALLLTVMVFPQIEIWLTRSFFDADLRVFPFRVAPLGEFVRKILPIFLFALAIAIALLGAVAAVRRRPLWGIGPRVAVYLLACLALGPGLAVNVVLKDNWGRPRPSTIAEFSGPKTYVRPFVLSDQCNDNCSFSSGHAALGFWAVAFALLAPPRRRQLSVAAALLFGSLVGLARIAQGGHFLSDVLVSGLLVSGLCLWLHRSMIRNAGFLPGKKTGPASL